MSVSGPIRKFLQQAMKGAGKKVPRLGDISSQIKKAEKKGDKATAKKLRTKKTKLLKAKKAIADKDKSKKDLAAKNKQAKGRKKATSLRFSSQTGSGRGKFERGNPPAPKRVAAKDTPFDADLDTPQVSGRAGGAATGKSARAGVINLGDDVVGFNNFLKMQQSKTGLRASKYKEKLNQITRSKTATKAQKNKAQAKIDAMDAKDEADFARSIRKSAATRTGMRTLEKGRYMNRNTGEIIDDPVNMKDLPGGRDLYIHKPTDKQIALAVRNMTVRQRLKKMKESPERDARTKKKLAQRIMATNPRRNKAKGGMGLKMPTADQVGLKKLPTAVRNKMGYMYGGGMAKKPRMGSMDYRKGGLLLIAVDMMKKNKKGRKK